MSFSVETVAAVEKAYNAIPSGTSQVLRVPNVDQFELLEVLQGLHAKMPDVFEAPDFCYDGQTDVLVHKS